MNVTGNMRKLTETCQDNLKLELKMIRQSPMKLNSTYTQRHIAKETVNKQRENKPVIKKDAKSNMKVL